MRNVDFAAAVAQLSRLQSRTLNCVEMSIGADDPLRDYETQSPPLSPVTCTWSYSSGDMCSHVVQQTPCHRKYLACLTGKRIKGQRTRSPAKFAQANSV